MKLMQSELKCLGAIARMGTAPASEIATTIHMARPNVSRAMVTLEDKGFVKTEKKGLSTIVSLSDTKHAALWRKISLEFAHMRLDRLLAGASLEVLSTVSCLTLGNRKEIADNSLVSVPSVAKVLERLKEVGILQRTTAGFGVSPRFETLREFVIEFRHYLNQRIAQDFASDAVIIWECNHEFIIESKRTQTNHGFQLTGPSSFPRFGIPLLLAKSYFFYSPLRRKLRIEDIVLHSLVSRTPSMLPLLLVWKKNERRISLQYSERQAEKYKATSRLKDIIAYFTTNGSQRPEGFPSWDEFVQRAQEYGIL
jgi:DNA-binding MarR family transcriptional regulator